MFTTNDVERSIASTYVSLQDNLERSVKALEKKTNSLLLQRTDVGSFITSGKAFNVVKCSFKNNQQKPNTVVDVKMAVNILDAELINPIYHYQKPIQDLLKEVVSNHIHEEIDRKVETINLSLQKDGKAKLDGKTELFERLKSLEGYLGFEEVDNDEQSKRYEYMSKQLIDSLDATTFEIPSHEWDPTNVRENLKSILDAEHVHSRGFNQVISMLTTILDNYKLGYQYINNLKNARDCNIMEYSPADQGELPDETFSIKLSYTDSDQLREQRKAYNAQTDALKKHIEQAAQVVEKLYLKHAAADKQTTYGDLAGKYLAKEGELPREWKELVFSEAKNLEKVTSNQEFVRDMKATFTLMETQLSRAFGNNFTPERQISSERIAFLKEQFSRFTAQINPHHLQQGLVIEMDVTSVKKNPTTLKNISNVLNELLFNISKKFVDQSIQDFEDKNKKEAAPLSERFNHVLNKMEDSLTGMGV